MRQIKILISRFFYVQISPTFCGQYICDVKNSQHDLHISVNYRVILAFREDFIFTKLVSQYAKFRENKILPKISIFTVDFA